MRTFAPPPRCPANPLRAFRLVVLVLASLLSADAFGYSCFICGSRIANTFVSMRDLVADERREVCDSCYQLKDQCYMCTLPIKTGLTLLDDGRAYCARDAQDSVLDDAAARRVCETGYDELNRLLIRHIEMPWTNVDFAIATWAEMRQLMQTPGLDRVCPLTLGYTRSLQTKDGDWRHTVRILGGRPREELQAVLAHELAHAWLNENLSPRRVLERHTTEGFCELLAHQFMKHLGAERALKQIEKNVYSRGQVGLFIATEKEYGLHTVLQWIRYGVDPFLTGEELDRIRRIEEPLAAPSTNLFRPPVSLAPPAVPDELTLTGISGSGKLRLALINDRTLGPGETARVRVGTTNVSLLCIEIGDASVRIRVDGEPADRELRLKSGSLRQPRL